MAEGSSEKLDKTKWKIFKYSIGSLTLNIGDEEPIKLEPTLIQSLYIEKDYDKDFLPIIIMNILLSDELNYKIYANQDTSFFNLQVKGETDNDGRGDDSIVYDYINDKFIVLPTQSTPNINQVELDNMKQSSTYGEGQFTLQDVSTVRTYILARKSDLTSTKNIVNKVLSSSNMLTAVSYLMSKSGCSNILMSPPDNSTAYKELILLPIPLCNQLKYLDNYYGIYKHGALFFFDLDRIYIVKKDANCTAYDKTEAKTVEITVHGSDTGEFIEKGSWTDDKNRIGYIDISSADFEISDKTSTSNEYVGDNSLIINNNATNSDAISNNSGSFNIITTSTHNQYCTQERQLRLKELSCVVTAMLNNCDLRLLKPNKKFKINSSSSKANKQINSLFRLSSLKLSFVKNGNLFTTIVQATLKESDT